MIIIINMRLFLVILAFSLTTPVFSGESLSLQQALKTAFPKAKRVVRKEIYLNSGQKKQIEQKHDVKLSGSYYVRYQLFADSLLQGYAYLDRHIVRSKMQTILVAFDSSANLHRVITVSFEEPAIYEAKPSWLAKLQGQRFNKLKMPAMLGSTITANRIQKSVKSIGAIHSFSLEQK